MHKEIATKIRRKTPITRTAGTVVNLNNRHLHKQILKTNGTTEASTRCKTKAQKARKASNNSNNRQERVVETKVVKKLGNSSTISSKHLIKSIRRKTSSIRILTKAGLTTKKIRDNSYPKALHKIITSTSRIHLITIPAVRHLERQTTSHLPIRVEIKASLRRFITTRTLSSSTITQQVAKITRTQTNQLKTCKIIQV